MQRYYASIALVAMVAAQQQIAFPLRPKLDGVEIDLYMHQTTWSDMIVEGDDTMYMHDRDRAYLSWAPEPEPYSYFKPNLLGGYMSYDIDLSEMPCGCITALYQTMMPAKQQNGELYDRHYWYCGAQQSKYGGESCPEFDIMEANTWGIHTTAHACEPPTAEGWYSAESCDFRGACEVSLETSGQEDSYGPGPEFAINSLQKFNVRIDYQDFEGHFVGYTTTLTQGDETVIFNGDCRDYLNRMTDNIKDGMAFIMSSWKPPSAKWLQGDRCNEECQWPVETVFENLEFWTYGGKAAKDVEIVYGKACSHLTGGQCGKDCTDCRFSWPEDEPTKWLSDWAYCRCKDDSVYSYGRPCGEEEDLDLTRCGSACEHCNLSWSSNDSLKWNSPDRECRCVPPQREEIEFGTSRCKNTNDGICGDSCDNCMWSWPQNDADTWASAHAMCRCQDE